MEIPSDADPRGAIYRQLYTLNKDYNPKEHVLSYDSVSQIDDWLWLGGCNTLDIDPFEHFKTQVGKEVDVVISIVNPGTYRRWQTNIDKERVVVSFTDNEHTYPVEHWKHLSELLHYHKGKGSTVFIHCLAGVSRSASTVMYYYNRYTSMNIVDAFKYVREKRPCVHPNKGFIRHLSGVYSDR